MKTTPTAFLSYAREDAATALQMYHDLTHKGVELWIDRKDLLPGQDWKGAIQEAIRASDHFIALLSSNSVSKKGFVQREISLALELLEEHPHGGIYLIPVRLDSCKILHPRLKDLHWLDLFEDYSRGLERILEALYHSTASAEGANNANESDTESKPSGILLPDRKNRDEVYRHRADEGRVGGKRKGGFFWDLEEDEESYDTRIVKEDGFWGGEVTVGRIDRDGRVFFRGTWLDEEEVGKIKKREHCFLSSACTEFMGLQDDCYELTTLRKFRDEFLVASREGRELVEVYYQLAPSMLDSIDRRADRAAILGRLYTELVLPSVQRISQGLHREAVGRYLRYTLRLANNLGIKTKQLGHELFEATHNTTLHRTPTALACACRR